MDVRVECWRINAFELWCWRRLLRIPWTARKSNESILKEISPEYSLEGLMLKLKFQYFGHLIQRTDSLEKTLMLEKTEGRQRRDDRGWDGWMASLTRWTWVWVSSGSWRWTGKPGVLQSMGLQSNATEWLNWLTGGTSLAVQWLRLCIPNEGGPVSIAGWGTRSCTPPTKTQSSQTRPYLQTESHWGLGLQQQQQQRAL